MTKGDIESIDKHIKKIGEINRENEQLARRAGYLEGKLEMLKKVRDAIAEINSKIEGGNHCDEYIDGYENGLVDAIEIIRKHKGVYE